jgi:4-aminobutyrate aminotransferase-like enzyme
MPVGPNMPGSFLLPAPNAYRSIFRHKDGTYDWETELNYGWNLIDSASCGSLAAVIVECIQSSAGIHVLPPGYLKAMKAHCEKRGMLLIVDEAQTGIGRYDDLSITILDITDRDDKVWRSLCN